MPEARRFSPRAGQGGVHRAELQGQCAGPVEVQEPASHLVALRTDGELVQEILILVLGPVYDQHALQGCGIQMFVLQETSSIVGHVFQEQEGIVVRLRKNRGFPLPRSYPP